MKQKKVVRKGRRTSNKKMSSNRKISQDSTERELKKRILRRKNFIRNSFLAKLPGSGNVAKKASVPASQDSEAAKQVSVAVPKKILSDNEPGNKKDDRIVSDKDTSKILSHTELPAIHDAGHTPANDDSHIRKSYDASHNKSHDSPHNKSHDSPHNKSLDSPHNKSLDSPHNKSLDSPHNSTAPHHPTGSHHSTSNTHQSLKDEIINGTDDVIKNMHDSEKKLSITDKNNYKFTADDILRRLFAVEDKKKKKVDVQEKTYLKKILSQAGYDIDPELLKTRVFRYNLIIVSVWSLSLLLYGLALGILSKLLALIVMSIVVFLPFLLLLTWGVIFLILDYKKYRRKTELEEVWPEYLQLVVSNINAGMLIDVALWSAVKPKYDVLAKEIEQVAKQTLTGKELSEALTEFAEKYDSIMVQRTISLLIEGMESGGRIATLLNKVSLDIQDTKIMRKEMSASVMTYSIFITFATIVAAPFLFGLSTQLLIIIQEIIGKLGQTSSTNTMITFSGDAVKVGDFKIFAYVMLAITSFMSACLIGSIRKGSIRDGLKFIPIFVITTMIIYYISTIVLASLFGGLI